MKTDHTPSPSYPRTLYCEVRKTPAGCVTRHEFLLRGWAVQRPDRSIPVGSGLLPLILALVAFGFFTPTVSAQGDVELQPFSHKLHVDKLWPSFFFKETWRDCQGCHRIEDSGPAPRDFQREIGAICQNCHQAEVQPTKARFAPLRPAEAGKRLNFYHGDHPWGLTYTTPDGKPAKLECKTCHQPDGDAVPDLIDRPTPDRKFCLSCHADGPGSETFSTTFIGKVNDRVSGAKSNRPFRHDSDTHSKTDCQHCHVEMSRADAGDFADYMFDPKTCYGAGCHTEEKLELVTGVGTRESLSRKTFIHKKHLSPKARQLDPRLNDCSFCHEIDARTGQARLAARFTRKLAPGEKGPAGCVECHADVCPPDHGQVGACRDCHQLDFGASVTWRELAQHRPKIDAPRPRATQFSTRTHSHAFLGENAAEECATCHVAALPEQPTRFPERAFDHAAHLSENPKSSECMACHEGIASSSDLKYFRASVEDGEPEEAGDETLLNYDRNECESCHPGRQPEPKFASEMRQVLDFNHRDHRDHFECIDCHPIPEAGSDGIVTLPSKVASCSGSDCHGHSAEQAERVGTLERSALEQCQFCHDEFPIPGTPMPVNRLRVVEARGQTIHTPDLPCDTCHGSRAQDDTRMASS
ncbi:MAG: cytochrome c3 family protein, partial [Planctomycetota bacterium]